MNKTIFKMVAVSAMIGSMVFIGGCRTKPKATGWDMNSAAIGTVDIPIEGGNLGMPMDGDRSLFPPVYFAYDSASVNPEEASKCEQVANHLRKGKGRGVIVEGHADERGSRDYNLTLGERRSLAVRDYLISLGVDPSAIQTKSYGEEQPEDMGHDESAWRKNRRAVFAIY